MRFERRDDGRDALSQGQSHLNDLATDTSRDAAGSVGVARGGDLPAAVGGLAQAMVGVLERHKKTVALGGVMLALQVRGEVFAWLRAHPEGATADEIAEALRHEGIVGLRGSATACPLARATGWEVLPAYRVLHVDWVELTPAEQTFVKLFDAGYYAELDEDEPESRTA